MAVTITRAQLAVQLRVIANETDAVPDGVGQVLDRLLSTSTVLVEKYAIEAPTETQNEAVARLCGYLYDKAPHEGRGGNPLILSGAAFLLAPFRARTVTVPTARSELTG